MVRRQILAAVRLLLVMTVLTGVLYPLAVTAVGRVLFPDQAHGSLVRSGDGTVVGSELIAQPFTGSGYFHPRPSAVDHDAASSGGSNLGPLNPELIDAVTRRAVSYRAENGLAATVPVPVDAVTASASGLDPHISLANARLQAARVGRARGMPEAQVMSMVDAHRESPILGFLGEPVVNVLVLNLELDRR